MLTAEALGPNAGLPSGRARGRGRRSAQTQADKAPGGQGGCQRVAVHPSGFAYLVRPRSILQGSSSMYLFSSKTRLITGFKTSCR